MTETRITPIDYVPSTEPSLKTAVTVVIPCFNESAGIEFLANRLREISDQYRDQHEFFFILVDDGSSDNTWELLGEQFSEWSNTELLRHAQNKGLMAAILTGTSAASTEIVCSMDSDCTFDPAQIPSMVEKLKEDVAMVTSSPYHPQGKVNNVPAWRIFLSRIASRLYRLILRNRLYCYTSCFRVFRRSVVGEIELQNPGFVGTAELVWRIEQKGDWRIVEVPSTLNVRQFGQSKCRVLIVSLRHISLMATIVFSKLRRSKQNTQRTAKSLAARID